MHLLLLLSTVGLALAASEPKEDLKCEDKYSNGEKYTSGNFVKKCTSSPNSYETSIVACISPSGKEIEIGGKVEEGGMIHSCVKTENGAKLEMDSAQNPSSDPSSPKENLKCADKYSNGQKFNENSFVKQCSSTPYSWSIKIVGCLTPEGKEIAPGGKVEEGRLVFSCVRTENGAKLENDLITKGCEDGKYKKGETYLSSNKRFLLKCIDDYGSNDILACKTDSDKDVKVGEELVEDGYKYKCVKESSGSVRYLKEPIGGARPAQQKGCGGYAVGDTILSKDKKFKFTCVSDGNVQFTSCLVEGGEVKANTKQTIGSITYDCKSTASGGASLGRQYNMEKE